MPPFRSLLLGAAALVVVGASDAVWAQAGLRDSPNFNAFPGAPSAAPPLSPESNAPPAAGVSTTDDALPLRPVEAEGVGAPNYGKPRKKRPKLYSPTSRSNPPLSPLVPYRGAAGLQRRLLNPLPAAKDAIDPVQPAPTVAVIQSPVRPRVPRADLEPFAPTGIRTGDLRLLPFVETSTGYETNPNQVAVGVKPSAVLRVAGGLDVQSDFTNHSLTASLRGGYSDFPANNVASRPDANGVVNGRFDLTRDDQINLEGRFVVATQTPGSPLLAVPNSVFIVSRPLITSEGATLGAAHRFNRLVLDLRGTFDRTQYGDALQSDGSTFRYSLENYNDYGIVGRASYELTPEIVPFAEVGFDSRVHDTTLDIGGFDRDSLGVTGRLGTSFQFARLFTGTIGAGYLERDYADRRLPNLRGPTVDASVIYAVTPLTTVTLRASTTASETTLVGASGAISRALSLEIGHVFFRRFTVSGIALYAPNDYQGLPVHETFTQFTLKGAYSLTRDVQLIGTATHQNLTSSLPGNTFSDTIFLVGLRLQR